MAEVNLPDLSLIWGSAGDILKPSDNKIQQGWSPEIPPRQWFNWLDNRQDEAIAHIAQHGIAVWSDTIEYQAGKSYVQGSDGLVYKAITTNTNINPVGGAAGNWQSAFLTADQAVQVATAAQSRAMTANNVYLSPLQLANAFTGTNQQLLTGGASGFQRLPGGLIIQWGTTPQTSTSALVTFPIPFSNSVFSVTLSPQGPSGATTQAVFSVTGLTNTSFEATNLGRLSRGQPSLSTPVNDATTWIAVGF